MGTGGGPGGNIPPPLAVSRRYPPGEKRGRERRERGKKEGEKKGKGGEREERGKGNDRIRVRGDIEAFSPQGDLSYWFLPGGGGMEAFFPQGGEACQILPWGVGLSQSSGQGGGIEAFNPQGGCQILPWGALSQSSAREGIEAFSPPSGGLSDSGGLQMCSFPRGGGSARFYLRWGDIISLSSARGVGV